MKNIYFKKSYELKKKSCLWLTHLLTLTGQNTRCTDGYSRSPRHPVLFGLRGITTESSATRNCNLNPTLSFKAAWALCHSRYGIVLTQTRGLWFPPTFQSKRTPILETVKLAARVTGATWAWESVEWGSNSHSVSYQLCDLLDTHKCKMRVTNFRSYSFGSWNKLT